MLLKAQLGLKNNSKSRKIRRRSKLTMNKTILRAVLICGTEDQEKERNFKKEFVEDDPSMLEVVHNVHSIVNISDEKKKKFQEETEKDCVLNKIIKYCEEGWPCGNKINGQLKKYLPLRSDWSSGPGDVTSLLAFSLPSTRSGVMLSYSSEVLHIGERKGEESRLLDFVEILDASLLREYSETTSGPFTSGSN
ncbi:hypothetical protein JTB14_036933 [Gonioctena quinquepunctata]|nr:hypothetical protein JTB14_036933 [Gonioctena quinquepunctata]